MNKDQDVAIDLFKSNGDPKESRKQGRRCAKAPIFGRYKIHFWDERHGLLPFLGSLGVSSVILLAINYAVLSPSTSPGPFSLSLFLPASAFSVAESAASRVSFGTIPVGTPGRRIAENFHENVESADISTSTRLRTLRNRTPEF